MVVRQPFHFVFKSHFEIALLTELKAVRLVAPRTVTDATDTPSLKVMVIISVFLCIKGKMYLVPKILPAVPMC